jgi:hypothetical protein
MSGGWLSGERATGLTLPVPILNIVNGFAVQVWHPSNVAAATSEVPVFYEIMIIERE